MSDSSKGNGTNQQPEGVQRREVIKGAATAGFIAASGLQPLVYAAESKLQRPELIRRENARPGTRDWLLTRTKTIPGKINPHLLNGRCEVIEGYCSANSVRAGETLKIKVSTNPVSDFKLEIFRTGYYGGTGAWLVKTFESLKGTPQPDPPVGENYVRECQWEPSVELKIPDEWLSGVYLGKLTAKKSGIQSYVIFIVRDDRPCDFLFQCSDLTWQSYNSWPNQEWSIYHDNSNNYRPKDKGLFVRSSVAQTIDARSMIRLVDWSCRHDGVRRPGRLSLIGLWLPFRSCRLTSDVL